VLPAGADQQPQQNAALARAELPDQVYAFALQVDLGAGKPIGRAGCRATARPLATITGEAGMRLSSTSAQPPETCPAPNPATTSPS